MKLIDIATRNDIPLWMEKNRKQPVMAEVGVREGVHLRSLMKAKPAIMVAVDLWEDDGTPARNDRGDSPAKIAAYYRTVMGMAREFGNIRVVKSLSVPAAALFDDGYFDFVYLDADHTYEGASADIKAWWPKVRSGGVLAGHDYVKATTPMRGITFGVIEAVTELCAAEKRSVHTTAAREKYASWFVEKP